jgi:hypothetical protein
MNIPKTPPQTFPDANKDIKEVDEYTVKINTVFSKQVAQSLMKVQKKKGLPYVQDVIRLAIANFLEKAGYL